MFTPHQAADSWSSEETLAEALWEQSKADHALSQDKRQEVMGKINSLGTWDNYFPVFRHEGGQFTLRHQETWSII